MNDRRGSLPLLTFLWGPSVTGLLTFLPGLIGLLTGHLLLFPSLGPTALILACSPDDPSARFYNVVVSHTIGLASAYTAVWLLGLSTTPSVFVVGHLSASRLAAATLAVVLAAALEMLLRAKHPPAASTTLLVALGSFKPVLHDATVVLGGVLVVAAAGAGLRRLGLRYIYQRSGLSD